MTTSTKNVEANHLRRYQNYQYYAVRNQLIDGVWKEWREEIRDKNSERKEKDMRSGGGGNAVTEPRGATTLGDFVLWQRWKDERSPV